MEKLDEAQAHDAVRMGLYGKIAVSIMPAYEGVMRNAVEGQTDCNLAVTACALERHRLAEGDYPETLEILESRYSIKLPRDLINGEALKYRRTSGGGYELYSVGWNGTDEGGEVGMDKGRYDKGRGDWVWEIPGQ